MSSGLFFFERCSLINCNSVCNQIFIMHVIKLYAYTVQVMRLYLLKKNIPLLIYPPELLGPPNQT